MKRIFNDLFDADLQLFAGTDDDKGGEEPLTFDDFLKLEGNQAEFDRRINKAINTAVTNAQNKWDIMNNDKISEAERLAKMTKEEQLTYRNKKLQETIDKLEAEKTSGQMQTQARAMLAEEGVKVPDSVVAHLVQEDAEETKKSVEAFSKAFNEAVQSAVKEALKGEPPKKGKKNTMTKEQILDIKDPVERRKKIAENIDLFG